MNIKLELLEKRKQLDEARENTDAIEEELEDLLSSLHCKCNRLAKVISTNWSYYLCIDCGETYFTEGYAKVVWKWHNCPKCGRTMYNKFDNSGTHEDTYVCTKCHKEYTTHELKILQGKYLKERKLSL